MKKITAAGLAALLSLSALCAGDAAIFVETGFSSDGNTFIFGEYGMTDKTYRGWAEIFTVDIATNEFVAGEVFRTNPSAATAGKSGREVYDALAAKNYATTRKYNCTTTSPDRVLYIRGDESKSQSDSIAFKDFSGAGGSKANYDIALIPTVNGAGKNARSSFFIMLEKRDESGNVLLRQRIGSPDIVRNGVTGYRIEKIMCDSSATSFIFVIAKMVEDDAGLSIRYMVEAAKITN